MKTAVIQMNSSGDKRRNIEKALRFLEEAVGQRARFILLPEVFNYRGSIQAGKNRQLIAEAIPGESTLPLMEAARRSRVFILAGSIYEKAARSQKVYNTSALISPEGKSSRSIARFISSMRS